MYKMYINLFQQYNKQKAVEKKSMVTVAMLGYLVLMVEIVSTCICL